MQAGESASDELLLLFRYPPRFAAALLEGTLPLRYCAGRLGADGHVVGLVTVEGGLVLFGLSIVLLQLCQASKVMVGLTGLVGLVEALKGSDETEKLLHTS